MCVIVTKPKGATMIGMDILHECWRNNPDGAGYMYVQDDGMIHIRKGFMQWKHFKSSVKSHHFGKDDIVVMHFRIATHGAVDEGHTHPFPVTESIHEMMQTDVICEYALAHNGILNIPVTGILSDTQQFIKDILAPLGLRTYDDNATQMLIAAFVAGSKIVMLHKTNGLLTFGKWVTEHGCQFSNDSYKRVKIMPKWNKRGEIYNEWGKIDDELDDKVYSEWLRRMERGDSHKNWEMYGV